MAVRVAIMGGYGGMGRIFARLFKAEGCMVTLTGPTEAKGVQAAADLGVEYSKDNAGAASAADVVVVTVPIAVTAKTIAEVAPHVRSGSMIMDLTSVKEEPCRLMAEHAREDAEVLGTHPVFGPRVGSIDGQVFVLTPVRGEKWTSWFRGILERNNAKIVDSNPSEHDEVMAVVQGLTHYAYISVGKALKDLDFDVKRSRQFSSPVYELMLDMVGRIIGQDPHLYAEIQMQNPRIPRIHDTFLRAAADISSSVKESRESDFVRMMAESARHFGDTERAMGRSDKAIGCLVSEMKLLKCLIGNEICLRHMYSGAVHAGVVEAVNAEEVSLVSGGKTQKLKLSNLQVLSKEELKDFKKNKYGVASKDYSAVFPKDADAGLISELLMRVNHSVTSVRIKDEYTGGKIGEGMKSICFGVDIIKDDVKGNDQDVAEFLKRIGGRLR